LQGILGKQQAAGASLVALSPQRAEHSQGQIEKHKLAFDILSDHGNAVAERFGLRFALPDDLRAVYLSIGIDLAKHNGEPSWTLAMPARFLVGRQGIVRAADVDPDYTRRPEPDKTLADLAALS
jgi:peroxiredoxin